MRLITTVKFDQQERAVIGQAAVHRALALMGDVNDERDLGVLSHLARGNPATRENLLKAAWVLRALRTVCVEQASTTYWASTMKPAGPLPEGSVPLIADPAGFIETMVQTRGQMVREVDAALELVDAAVRYASPARDGEED